MSLGFLHVIPRYVYRTFCNNEHKHGVLIGSTSRRSTEHKTGKQKIKDQVKFVFAHLICISTSPLNSDARNQKQAPAQPIT